MCQSVGSKSTNSMQEHLGQKAKLFNKVSQSVRNLPNSTQEHLGQKAKLFNFCSTPKAKGAGAIVFSAVKTAVNVAGGLSRRREKK